ncbi:MAG: hypothetical protein A2089_12625 [Elusimicrobia bacterium GWD2_63_28]|nr:MAG: hypothetical protein A2089_12625 [Elusimicrobia bacterium GWD2_63_28]
MNKSKDNIQTNFSVIWERPGLVRPAPPPRYAEYRTAWAENPRKGIVTDFPINVDLEITNACNLSCPHCASARKNWGDEKTGFIEESLVKKVLDEVKAGAGMSMKFSLRGEPLLHPKAALFLECAKEAGLADYYFNTNGVPLTRDIAVELVKHRLPRISISVGGWDEASFARSQAGADLGALKRNISILRDVRQSYGSAAPIIRIQATFIKDLRTRLKEFKELWMPLADEIGLVDFREESSPAARPASATAGFRCNFLWQRLVVLWDGSVYPCLFHGVKYPEPLRLGNVRTATLGGMWKSPRMEALRRLHLAGTSHENACCAGCSYRRAEIDKLVSREQGRDD